MSGLLPLRDHDHLHLIAVSADHVNLLLSHFVHLLCSIGLWEA